MSVTSLTTGVVRGEQVGCLRGLETWDLWEKNSCAVAGKKKGSIGSLFISRRKKEVSCRKKAMKGL